MAQFKVSPPWITHIHYIEHIFGDDPDVTVKSNEELRQVRLFVDGQDKADAIAKLIKKKIAFGDETLTIEVVPCNDETLASTVRKAFAGNEAVSRIIDRSGSAVPFYDDRVFVLFKPEVVQFYNDNLTDFYGNENTLYHLIAREVFDAGPSVAFGTESVWTELD
jgi:hypothetical protein